MQSKRVTSRAKFAHLFVGTALAGGFAVPALAQDAPAPQHRAVDGNGVDLINGGLSLRATDISIGPSDLGGLAYERNTESNPLANKGYEGWVNVNSSGEVFVTIGGISEKFVLSGSVYTPTNGGGSKLTHPSYTAWIYEKADGTQYTLFRDDITDTSFTLSGISKIRYPTGHEVNLHWKRKQFNLPGCTMRPCETTTRQRLSSITNSSSYQLKFSYAANWGAVGPSTGIPGWITLTQIQAINNEIDACDPLADTCTGLTQSWPVATYDQTISGGTTTLTVVNDRGESWRYTKTATSLGIKRPSAASDTTTVSLSSGKVTSLTSDGITTGYSFVDAAGVRTATVTAPGSIQTIVKSSLTTKQLSSVTNPLGQTTSYQYDRSGRLTQISYPEGNKTVLGYDARGNVTTTTLKAKAGSGLADIVTTASYPASCTNPLTCNLPTWTKDAKLNQTDYTYNTTHGGILTVTEPADAAGVRPQTRYGYTLTGGVWMLTSVSACQASASCAGTATESRTTIGYDANLLPNSVTQSAGNGSVSATTAITYSPVGDVKTVDGSLAGTGDTTTYRYGPGRRLAGIVGPDPDGAGTRKPTAQRTTYNSDGQIVLSETGIVNDASDTAWTGFSSQEQVATTYDTNARPVKSELKSGGTTYAVTQTSYDALGRVDCTAQRMNPTIFGSLPASACTVGTAGTGTNAFGPDRIVKNSYDAASRITKVQTAYGVTGVQANEVTTAYTNNGQVDYVIDAENNRTEYSYDGHDRLVKTEYPSATKGANAANAADYEQLGYDANGNVTSRRLRDGTSIAYGYDKLDRLTLKNLPGTEPHITYSYDLLGNAKSAVQGTQTLSFTYDALGRNLTQVGPQGTTTYGYDTAGRRTSMAYPGGTLTINTDYDVAGNVTKIRENGATTGVGVLATYAYDNLGRRTSVTFGNGSVQSFGYDPVSRLSTLTNNLGGTATTHDLTQTFGYNPASQIASVTRSNDAYAWQAHYNVDRSYTINGLNRIMNVGSTAFTYDGRGNLTNDGTNAFTYTSENLLKTGPASATLAYDPLGRLYQTVGSGVTTRFQYDGADLIAEYNASNAVQRRYVHGPGVDNPIAWYEGSAVSNATRRFLMADERGSVVSITDSSGATININAYDEYGIPAPGNVGRFGYTGQTWLPEVGMWYYKARIYSPTLGRFMQTDPIGYNDGMNWYNYVGSDPVNFGDPTGLEMCPDGSGDICVTAKKKGGGIWAWLRRTFGGGGGGGSGGGSKPSRPAPKTVEPDSHRYGVNVPTVCNADDAFSRILEAGNSAPGAPQAVEGTRANIQLYGNNPITQVVDSKNRTVTNITQVGHIFHSGTVFIRVTPAAGNTSDIHIVGTGVGNNTLWYNNVIGVSFFGNMANSIALNCASAAGIPLPTGL